MNRYILLLLLFPGMLFSEVCHINKKRDAAPEMKACIANNKDGVIEIPVGKYVLKESIDLNGKSLKTAGVTKRCRKRSKHCAEFVVSKRYDDIDGVFALKWGRSKLENIRLNGNKLRRRKVREDICRSPWGHRYGIGILVAAPGSIVEGVAVYDVPCGTGLEVWRSANNVLINKNFFKNNGNHKQYWADGLTVHGTENSVFTKNKFVGNTDIDMIFGGCVNCVIERNKVKHNNDPDQGAFAGIMFHSFLPRGEVADYTGTIAQFNKVDCGLENRCGFGILVGSNPWINVGIKNLRLDYNRVENAQNGIAVTRSTSGVTLTDNDVTTNAPGDKRFLTSCEPEMRTGKRYNISRRAEDVNFTYLIDGTPPTRSKRWDKSSCIPGIYNP